LLRPEENYRQCYAQPFPTHPREVFPCTFSHLHQRQ
jgi:hypothetical protein